MISQTSAGGVVYRVRDDRIEIALALRSGVRPVWGLPKGLVDEGETLEEAAEREVREETGLTGVNERKIDSIEYWFVLKEDNQRVHKTVHFFLFRYTGGDPANHDWETAEVRWFTAEEALRTMAYKNEKAVLAKAAGMIG